MLSLYLLLIVVLVFNQHTMIQPWRIWVGGVPINLMEFGIVLVILNSLIFPTGFREPLDTQKRNFLWLILGLYLLTGIGGTFIGIVRGAPMYNVVQMVKIALKLPAGVVCGYLAIKNTRQARRLIKLTGWLCCLMCPLVLAQVSRGSSSYIAGGSVNVLRTISYNTSAAGIFAGFLIYSAAVNRGYFSRTTGLVILAMSVIACFGTLSRSDWVPLFLSILAVVWMTPKDLRIYSWRAAFTSGIWVIIVLIVGFIAAQVFLQLDMFEIMRNRLASFLQPFSEPKGPYMGRWLAIKIEISMWLHSTIIFGAGFGSLQLFELMTEAEASFRHNSWTNMLAQAGLVGVATLATSLIVCYRLGKKMVLSNNEDLRAVGAFAVVATFYCALASFLTMGLSNERLGLFFGIVVGMAIKCYRFSSEPYWSDEYLEYGEMDESLIPTTYYEGNVYE